MPTWRHDPHADVPAHAAAVLGSPFRAGFVQWLDASDAPPENLAVPAVYQNGATITCTLGEWTGEPTGYAYQWQADGADTGTDAATYDVTAGDVGKTFTCTVTATNGYGSTTAPPSNAVVAV